MRALLSRRTRPVTILPRVALRNRFWAVRERARDGLLREAGLVGCDNSPCLATSMIAQRDLRIAWTAGAGHGHPSADRVTIPRPDFRNRWRDHGQ